MRCGFFCLFVCSLYARSNRILPLKWYHSYNLYLPSCLLNWGIANCILINYISDSIEISGSVQLIPMILSSEKNFWDQIRIHKEILCKDGWGQETLLTGLLFQTLRSLRSHFRAATSVGENTTKRNPGIRGGRIHVNVCHAICFMHSSLNEVQERGSCKMMRCAWPCLLMERGRTCSYGSAMWYAQLACWADCCSVAVVQSTMMWSHRAHQGNWSWKTKPGLFWHLSISASSALPPKKVPIKNIWDL